MLLLPFADSTLVEEVFAFSHRRSTNESMACADGGPELGVTLEQTAHLELLAYTSIYKTNDTFTDKQVFCVVFLLTVLLLRPNYLGDGSGFVVV